MKKFDFKPLPEPKEKEEIKISHGSNPSKLQNNMLCVSVHFRLEKGLVDRTKEYAYQERVTQKEVISQALDEFLRKSNY